MTAVSTAARGLLRADRSALPAVLLLIALTGAALRFATLGTQSLGLDETFTAWLIRKDFSSMLSSAAHTEGTPPTYYIAAWGWARLFGDSEVGLRSLSALAGTATIPLAGLLAARLSEARAGIAAAALVAANPLLIWYSGEARAYALLVLQATLSLLLLLAVLRRPTRGRLAAWSASAALMLATHYFAAFLVAGEALMLYVRAPRRAVLAACVAPILTAVALLPLMLGQKQTAVSELSGSVPREVAIVVKQLVTGPNVPRDRLIAGIACACILVALLAFRDPTRRAAARLPAALAAAATAPLLVLALAGSDYLSTRYLLPGLVPALVSVSIGFAASRTTAAAAIVLVAVSLLAVTLVQLDDRYQRVGYRQASEALGRPQRSRAVIYTPKAHFEVYLPGAHEMPATGAAVGEIDVVALAYTDRGDLTPPRAPTKSPPAGFRVIARRETPNLTLVRYASTVRRRVRPAMLRGLDITPGDYPAVLVQVP